MCDNVKLFQNVISMKAIAIYKYFLSDILFLIIESEMIKISDDMWNFMFKKVKM